MTLPPKALNVLADIKANLLSSDVIITPEEPKLPPILPKKPRVEWSSQCMRHARERHGAFQRACRRKEFHAPVY